MSEAKITLDRETFKALASDTRLDILKLLDERQMTVSEIGRALNLNKATCFEHLAKLVEAGLVNKLEDDRKWVYYQLTWKGRRILNPEKITFALLLSSSFGALVTAALTLWMWWQGKLLEIRTEIPPEEPEMGVMTQPDTPPEPIVEITYQLVRDPALLWTALALFAVTAALLVMGVQVWRKAKARAAA